MYLKGNKMQKRDKNIELLKERTLILTQTNPDGDMMFNAWLKEGLNADIIFKPKKKAIRFIRRFWVNNFIPGYSYWFGNWKKNLEKYDTVIVHADVRTRTVPAYIHHIKPEMRIIYWYWNPVNKNTSSELTRDNNIECWSFDENDCKKYNMKKNIQYYYEQILEYESKMQYDIYFVGHDKGRKNRIQEIEKQINELGMTGKFDLIEDEKKEISYSEVQKRIEKSKAILEIIQTGQVGCTLRALEALFFRKKLITTNKNVVNEDFYNKNNIFIYGIDDIDNLPEFVNSAYDNNSDKFRYDHTIEAWLQNFFTRRD